MMAVTKKCTATNFFDLMVHSAVLNRVHVREVAKQKVLPFLVDVWQQVNLTEWESLKQTKLQRMV